MRLSRNSVGAGALALCLIAIGIPAIGQEKPESILPPGFGEPVTAPAPAATATPSAPSTPDETPSSGVPSVLGAQATDASDVSDEAGTPAPLDPKLLAKYELPDYARRSTAMVGVVGIAEGGLKPKAFGNADGRFLEALMGRLKAPIASRWVSIGLRQALASKVMTPSHVNGVDFAAERAWLLLRMGESVVARAMVQSVDTDRYTPKMFEAAMQASLATADPAVVCPVVQSAKSFSSDRAWTMFDAMCGALAGNGEEANQKIRAARRIGTARGIDLLLAEKIVGAGGKGSTVTIEWDGVDQLTIWRYGLAIASNTEIPAPLFGTVSPRVQFWRAQAPMLAERLRAPSAELAAAQGVLSSAALVDLYGKIEGDEDQASAEVGVARDLRTAYADPDRDARLVALRALWTEPRTPRGQYARLILTARAAAGIAPYRDAPDADRLIAAMLTAGLERAALRWQEDAVRGSDGWAMLALVDSAVTVSRGEVDTYRGRATDPSGIKARMLLAGLAGLGKLSEGDAKALGRSLSVNLDSANSWTRAIHHAAARNQPATVLLLAAVGMQTYNWQGISPEAVYHIVSSLQQVGLEGQARMVAVEALTRL